MPNVQTISQIGQEYYNLRPKRSSIEYLKPYLHERIIQSFDAHEILFFFVFSLFIISFCMFLIHVDRCKEDKSNEPKNSLQL